MQAQSGSSSQEQNQNAENDGNNKNDKCSWPELLDKHSLDQSFQKFVSKENGKEISLYHHHANRIFDVANEVQKISMLSDVTLVTDDGLEILTHKIILSACSPYFYAMFRNFGEREEHRITLKDIDHDILKLLVDFIYSAEIHITEGNVQRLLAAANLLQLTVVVNACGDFLLRQLHPSNCLGIRAFANQYDCLELLAQTDGYIEHYFTEIIKYEEFFSLSAQQLVKLISNDRLNVPSEETVFECVISWINHNQEKREEYLVQLIEQVRLPLISQTYLFERVWEEKLIKANSQSKDYLIEALKYALPKETKNSVSLTLSSEMRTPRELPKVIVVVGGNSLKAARSAECFDIGSNTWYPLSDLPTDFCGGGITLLEGKIYAVGGCTSSGTPLGNMNVYDPATDQWSACPEMRVKRSNLGVATLRNQIYAIGGRNGDMIHSSVEVYNPKTKKWAMTKKMPTPRSDFGVGSYNDYLYVFGGCGKTGENILNNVLRYDPYRQDWAEEEIMKVPVRNAGLTLYHCDFYVIGGQSQDGGIMKRVTLYNPFDGEWWSDGSVDDMPDGRKDAAVVGLDDFLYVIGGHDGKRCLTSVNVFCAETETWEVLQNSMSVERSQAGAIIIDKPHNYL